jgi:low temperature requirement protein LtrA
VPPESRQAGQRETAENLEGTALAPSPESEPPTEDEVRVTTLELFFDLVFVFTVTQLTHLIAHHPTWGSLGHVALTFGVIWWMYTGYVWLTNEVAPTSSTRRTWLFAAMVGFLIIALAIPEAYGRSGLAFGVGYFLITVVHAGLFYSNGGASTARAMLRFGPFNLLAAGLILTGGLVDDPARTALWCAAFVIQVASPYLGGAANFTIRSAHFAERHGLVIIVALGESVISIGAGLNGVAITPTLVTIVALGLGLTYTLWWAYFGFDDERGERALGATPPNKRPFVAAVAYGYALYPMLVGIVLVAAGIQLSIAHQHESLSTAAALMLAGGVALYLLGQAAFRLTLGLPHPELRLLGAVIAMVTVPLGTHSVAWVQMSALALLTMGFVILDDLLSLRRGERTHYLP